MLSVAVNGFWVAFMASGVLGVISMAAPHSGFAVVSALFAVLLFLGSFPMLALVLATELVPKRIVLPMLGYLWAGVYVSLWPFPDHVVPWVSGASNILQVLLGVFLAWKFRAPGHTWKAPFAAREGRFFRWQYTVIGWFALQVASLVALVAIFFEVSALISATTGGYVRLRPNGLYLVERQFKEGDREVRLSGMMHIATEEFYDDVLPKADPKHPSVVLLEGVTDDKNLLDDNHLDYTRVARLFQLTAQSESTFSRKAYARAKLHNHPKDDSPVEMEEWGDDNFTSHEYRHADVDISNLRPKTIAYIITLSRLMEAPTWRDILLELQDPSSPINDSDAQAQVWDDILHARNRRLIAEIQSALPDFQRIIVPWGAAHLSEIERWLKGQHFVQSGEVERRALKFF
ncbi:hypothetical protein DB345_05430 [Spartobacteria bacterium LR76]|nr:hypothetical protein DB345_05430 [Spartobacteria bacterium LR76]